ncbi:MAG: VOC family protein [Planctomyces sp.]|nr:VOC family protein [Planctomyces sp.]
MNTKIFVNLPVSDLPTSREFYIGLGFTLNPQYSNDDGACIVISEEIYVMLLTRKYFGTFTPKAISDAQATTEVLLALSADDRAGVDALVARATAAGGSTYAEPRDLGFMYQHGFQDPDGHMWEVFWMAGPPPQEG